MKKLIPALAVLGSAVAFAVYKMKKDEKKQIMELDQDLLLDEDEPVLHHMGADQTVEKKEEVKDFVRKSEKAVEKNISEAWNKAKQKEEKITDRFSEFTDEAEDKINDIYGKIKRNADDYSDQVQDKVNSIRDAMNEAIEEEEYILEEPAVSDSEAQSAQVEETYNEDYPHLTNTLVQSIKDMTGEAMNSLASDGDVHEHERPVQHMVTFKTAADLDSFKNKVINKGFVITKGEGDLDLVVLHISPIDNTKLLSNILFLADQTYANNGEYKGWQSKVSY